MNARKLLAIAGFVTFTLAGAGTVQAQEEVAEDLVLLKTTIKTSNGGTFHYTPGAHAELFSPTTVTCPVQFRILRVELSTQFRGKTAAVQPLSAGTAGIEIDGTPDGLQPTSYGAFADGANSWSSQAFAIMKDGVSNGDHTVTVSFASLGPGKVLLNGVTLTVQVFKAHMEAAMNALEGNSVNYNDGTGITALSGSEVSESMAYDNALYSPRVQAPLGYSIHPPFMGYVDGMHPRRLIDPSHGTRPDDPGR